MTRIRAGGTGASAAVQAGGHGTTPPAGVIAQRAMTEVAGKMAASINDALGLAGGETGQWQGNGNDPYEIEQMAEALATELGGSASEIGELSRALHAFVQESAALFAARPESRSLAFIQTVIGEGLIENGAIADLPAVTRHIDAATTGLHGAIR
jgi:N-acetylglucosamine-6-phosphate deacetylase